MFAPSPQSEPVPAAIGALPRHPDERAEEQQRLLALVAGPSHDPGAFRRRRNAALDLRFHQRPETTAKLIELVLSPNDELCFLAAVALDQTRSPEARAALVFAALRPRKSPGIREQALDALGRAANEAEVAAFLDLLLAPEASAEMQTVAAHGLRERVHDRDSVLRLLAAWREQGPSPCWLIPLAGSRDELAVEALAAISGQSYLDDRIREEATLGLLLSDHEQAAPLLLNLFSSLPRYAHWFLRQNELFLPPTRTTLTMLRIITAVPCGLENRSLRTTIELAKAALTRLKPSNSQ